MTLDDLLTPEVVERVKWREPHECGQHPHPGDHYCPIAQEGWECDGHIAFDPNWQRWEVVDTGHAPSCKERWAPLTEVMEAYAEVRVERDRARVAFEAIKVLIEAVGDSMTDPATAAVKADLASRILGSTDLEALAGFWEREAKTVRKNGDSAEPGTASPGPVPEETEDRSARLTLTELRKIAPGAHTFLLRPEQVAPEPLQEPPEHSEGEE